MRFEVELRFADRPVPAIALSPHEFICRCVKPYPENIKWLKQDS